MEYFFVTSVEKIQVSLKSEKNVKSSLREDKYAVMIKLRYFFFFLQSEMFLTKFVAQIKSQFGFFTALFLNRVDFEKMLKNVVELGRTQMKIWRMYIASWIPRVKCTHLYTVILCNFVVPTCSIR